MQLIPLTTRIPRGQAKVLKSLSESTKIPQAELIREGINLIVQRYREDIVTPQLRKEIESLLNEDRNLLEKLAKE